MSLLLLFGGVDTSATGTVARTLGDVVPTATGTLTITGTVGQTLGNVTSTAVGGYADVAGTVARTLGNVTVTASGISNASVTGLLAVTLGNVTSAADTEGYTVPGARITFIGEHRLALPPPPDIEDPKVGDYLEYLRQHTQDAYNRLADDLARLQRDARAVADIANTAIYQSDTITLNSTINESITNGDIIIDGGDPLPSTFQDWAEQISSMVSDQAAWSQHAISRPYTATGQDFSGSYDTTGAEANSVVVGTSAATLTASNGYALPGYASIAYTLTGSVTVTDFPAIFKLEVLDDGATAVVETHKLFVPIGTFPIAMTAVGHNKFDDTQGIGFRLTIIGSGGTTTIARPVAHTDYNMRVSLVELFRPIGSNVDHVRDPLTVW